MGSFDYVFWNLFLKTIFKLKNKKQFLKINFKKHSQMIILTKFNDILSKVSNMSLLQNE